MKSSIKLLLGLMVAVSSTQAASLILGDTGGNSRGTDAIDIQTSRSNATEVASGEYSIAVGVENTVSEEFSVAVGQQNSVAGYAASAFGQFNSISGTGFGAAFGTANSVYASSIFGIPAMAFGNGNNPAGENVYVFGSGNTTTANNLCIFGRDINNNIAASVMIGPSDSAKVTILSTGYVGIGLGTTAPSEMLNVGGNIKATGDVEVADSGEGVILKSPNGTRFRITISNAGALTATSL